MTLVYGTFAVIGGTVMLCQFAMTLLGLSDDGGHDVGHDGGHGSDGHDVGGNSHSGDDTADAAQHSSDWLFGVVTFRTVIAAMTFFGLSGLAAHSSGVQPAQSFLIALAAGAAAMYGVHQIMQALYKLRSDGTARIGRSVGQSGSVYLRVPGQRSGVGKVTVNLRDRTVEYLAVTAHDTLPTGAKIVVTRVVSVDTVEVEPVGVEAKETSNV
jgi:hypothetical protein